MYNFVQNNAVNVWDVLGLKTGSFKGLSIKIEFWDKNVFKDQQLLVLKAGVSFSCKCGDLLIEDSFNDTKDTSFSWGMA
ncbi:MAG: hypothetical protein ACRC37_06830, partial [Lentisphaeria bacterium]